MRVVGADQYRQHGFAVFPAACPPAFVADCTGHLHRLQVALQHRSPIVTASLTLDTFLADLTRHRHLIEIATCLLGAPCVAFGCTYFVKEPRRGPAVLWHQDGYPWRTRLGIGEAVTLWLALDRSDQDTGGLMVIPGSHTLAAQPLRPHAGPADVFGYEIDPALVDAARAQPVTLLPGDISAHHPNVIHGSGPNRSPYLRRGLAIRYRPA
jgi:ectoine hydroxylase-related dioxygenase (phytanoyl-CoA dioxygenase family)